MTPNPYQIAAFTEAARARSFTKAAAAMNVTQSSVTQHVAKLERLIGAPLFVRRRDGLELTRAGRELFDITDRLRTLEQLVAERVADFGSLASGHLTLIANAPRPAMPIIRRYVERYPHINIEFSLFNWTIAMAKLRAREVDVAIVTEPEPSPGLYMRELGETRYAAHVARDHPLASRERVTLTELAGERLILPEDGSFTQRVFMAKAAEVGCQFNRIVKTTTFPVVKEAVLHGVGVGLLLVDSLFASSNLVTIEIDEMPERYRNFLVTPEEKKDLRIVRSLLEVAL